MTLFIKSSCFLLQIYIFIKNIWVFKEHFKLLHKGQLSLRTNPCLKKNYFITVVRLFQADQQNRWLPMQPVIVFCTKDSSNVYK